MNFSEKIAEDRRLCILRLLVEADGRANESVLQDGLSMLGLDAGLTRTVLRADLDFLRERGLVRIEWFNDKVGGAYRAPRRRGRRRQGTRRRHRPPEPENRDVTGHQVRQFDEAYLARRAPQKLKLLNFIRAEVRAGRPFPSFGAMAQFMGWRQPVRPGTRVRRSISNTARWRRR